MTSRSTPPDVRVPGAANGIDNPWFDSTSAPLYVWTFPARFTDDELAAAIAAHAAWRREATFQSAFIVDISGIEHASARQRWMVGRHLLDAADHARAHVVATALVVTSPLHRALATTVFWMHAPPTHVELVSNREEGVAYCTSKMTVPKRGDP